MNRLTGCLCLEALLRSRSPLVLVGELEDRVAALSFAPAARAGREQPGRLPGRGQGG